MFIAINKSKHKSGKVYQSILLRESYREGKKVKKKTIANLSHCTEEEINQIRAILQIKNKPLYAEQKFESIQGKSVGSVYVLYKIAKRLGIVDALGTNFHANLALWLIISRIIEQGSRLSATRLDSIYDIASIIGLKRGFDENDLYDSLHWLSENQNKIENSLFNKKKSPQKFYWYDVTSSYFEGQCNDLAAFGYNRDKKKGKRIIVIGLLCRDEGDPVSIEAFKGNSQDTETFENQLIKLKNRFECESVTIVSDRGLIREKQKKLLHQYGFHYITALPMPQIVSLLNKSLLKLENFTNDLRSFVHDDRRYIYRCNPERALETQRQRNERLETAQRKVDQENFRLEQKLKCSAYVAKKRINKILKKLCIFEWVEVSIIKRKLILKTNEENLKKKSEFDGCYVWTTDLKEEEISNREVYNRYKDLKYIEDDFRTFKSNDLEIRPIFVRSEKSTRGHLLVIMLAHIILRELRQAWVKFDKTAGEILTELSFLCRNKIKFSNGQTIDNIPTPNDRMTSFLEAINVILPKEIKELNPKVVTRHKVR